MGNHKFIELVDHLNRAIKVPILPQRIISLCPSITETLYELGLGDRVVGRTRYCIHPADQVCAARIVGGTKQINFEHVAKLAPDLIITEKEENPKELVEELAEKYPVFVANVENVQDALKMIVDIGVLTGTSMTATPLIQQIEKGLEKIVRDQPNKVAYLIWRKPYMVVGSPTYIDSILSVAGWENPFRARAERYPIVSLEELREVNLDYIFLSSEPFPFTEQHFEEFQEILPATKIVLVDGEIFSWYGARMRRLPDYIQQLTKDINIRNRL